MTFSADVHTLIAESDDGLHATAPWWERIPLGTVAQVLNGYPFDSKFFNDHDGERLIRIRDVTAGDTSTFYSGPVPDGFWVKPSDILVGMDGDFNLRVWRSERGLLNQRVCKLIPQTAVLEPAFLAFVLPGYLKLINDHTHSVTVRHLSSKTLQELPIPLPPLPEQRRIVARIEALFARTRGARADLARVEKLTERHQDRLLDAATKGLLADYSSLCAEGKQPLATLRRDTWTAGYRRRASALHRALPKAWQERYPLPVDPPAQPDWLPEGWDWVSLDSLAWDAGYGTSEKCDAGWTGTPVLRIPNIVQRALDARDLKFSKALLPGMEVDGVQAGDLLIVRTNGSRDLVGRGVVVFDALDRPTHYASYLIRFRLLPDPSLWLWVSLLWRSPLIHDQVLARAASSAGQYNISMTELSQFGIPLPPRAIRLQIADRVDRFLSGAAIADHESARALTLLDHLEKSILARAFRGELVPQDPADEPAEALLARLNAERAAAPVPRRRRARA